MTKYPEVDKLIVQAAKTDRLDTLKTLLRNRYALLESKNLHCDDWEDEGWHSPEDDTLAFEVRGPILEKLLTFELQHKALVRGFLEKTSLFQPQDILWAYYIPSCGKDVTKIIRPDTVEFYISKMSKTERFEWINLDSADNNLLADAVCYEDIEMVEFFLKEGTKPNSIPADWADWNESSGTILGSAIRMGNREIVELLLKYGAKVEYLLFDYTGEYICELSRKKLNLLKSILTDMGKFDDMPLLDYTLERQI
jgi:ankyrin repeat protein